MADETRTLIDAAVEHLPQAKWENVQGIDGWLVAKTLPAGTKIEFEDMSRFEDAPSRIRQKVHLETPASFAEYVNDYKSGPTRMFADLARREVVALLDYHGRADGFDAPSWCEHRAILPVQFTPAFAAWHGISGKWMAQPDFCEFLLEHAEDAEFPEPADLIEVSRKFSVLSDVNFTSNHDASTNERAFTYEKKGKPSGTVTCPERIRMSTPVFYGTEPVMWGVRLAWDTPDNKLAFKATIHRLDELLDAEFDKVCRDIAGQCDGVRLHRGAVGG